MKSSLILTIGSTLAALIILGIRSYFHPATFSFTTSLIVLTITTLLLSFFLINNPHDSSH